MTNPLARYCGGARGAAIVRVLGLVGLVASCGRSQPSPAPQAAVSGIEEARGFIDRGQLDAALGRLQRMPSDVEALYLQGVVWAKKAETAPAPTAAPLSSPAPKGATPPPVPELKKEEMEALGFFERAVASNAAHAKAHMAIGELIAPHAIRRYNAEAAALTASQKKGRRPKSPEPTPIPAPVVDLSADRVIRSFRKAAEADRTWKAPLDALIAFCVRVRRLDDGDAAFQGLIKLEKAKPEPLTRYGDFLLNERKDPQGAIARYREALMWQSDDETTRGRLAGVFLAMGIDHYRRREYALAEARFLEADKYITDRKSPQGRTLQEHMSKLREIRQR